VLENHHAYVALQVLSSNACNLLAALDNKQRSGVRRTVHIPSN
jgi:hypothetical protein